ncbi:glycoside hydrolase [Clostridium botulinum]|uniref:Exported peptidoglycan lytic protein n=1 Tax=Clostridium botulinum (strain Eklund 17B / Type B) TaxID=935198 RepID=B2TRY3_CLOBB|nr:MULTISPECIES: C40 family peptidase [unclassified Clostridium]ACD22921.1 putative exported peptidoglycan lytic protein [Clostridium botulinum B str. Eklund 17B (NRP)]MBY6976852.1 C40 family peptidase [Clostridium botulinum]MBY7002030.1 C40 family peptidase [Clostridium botulinum]MCR1272917.1 NlpC/P60 family protein [Clostridium botulinum]NFD69724.1 glycoside hydrolase [Clostridium botulinum]
MKKKFTIIIISAVILLNSVSSTISVSAAPNNLSINEVIQNIQEYDSKIETNMDKLNKYKEQILEKENEIKANEEDVEIAKRNLEQKDELLSERLRNVHMDGGFEVTPLKYLEAFFTSGNIMDAVEKVQVISQMCKSDKKLVIEAKNAEQNLNDMQKKIEKENEELQKNKDEIEKNIKELEDQKKQLVDYVQENSDILIDSTSSIIPITLSSDISEEARAIIKEAQKYLGIPYLWGGTTPDGFDCSGLMQYVFNSQGIEIPRVSQDQQSFAEPINLSELKPGDLVFNKPSNSTHVGLYIGDDKYLHAPHTGDVVKISTLSTSNMKYAGRVLKVD